jgi:hypothetical protein
VETNYSVDENVLGNSPTRPDPKNFRVLTLTNEKFARLKAEDLADDRFARKFEKEGLF